MENLYRLLKSQAKLKLNIYFQNKEKNTEIYGCSIISLIHSSQLVWSAILRKTIGKALRKDAWVTFWTGSYRGFKFSSNFTASNVSAQLTVSSGWKINYGWVSVCRSVTKKTIFCFFRFSIKISFFDENFYFWCEVRFSAKISINNWYLFKTTLIEV